MTRPQLTDLITSVRASRRNSSDPAHPTSAQNCALSPTPPAASCSLVAVKAHFFEENTMGGNAIFAAITKKDLFEVGLLQPPDRLAGLANELIVPVDRQIETLHRSIARLERARELLRPRLMNGEMEV